MANDLDQLWRDMCETAEARLAGMGRVPSAFVVLGREGKLAEISERNAVSKDAALRLVALASVAIYAEAIVQMGEAKLTVKRAKSGAVVKGGTPHLMVMQAEMSEGGEKRYRQHLREIVRDRDGEVLELKAAPLFQGTMMRAHIGEYLLREAPDLEAQQLARRFLAALGEDSDPSTLH